MGCSNPLIQNMQWHKKYTSSGWTTYTMTHLNWANSRMQQRTDTKAAMTQKLHTFSLDNLHHDTFTLGQGQGAAMHWYQSCNDAKSYTPSGWTTYTHLNWAKGRMQQTHWYKNLRWQKKYTPSGRATDTMTHLHCASVPLHATSYKPLSWEL